MQEGPDPYYHLLMQATRHNRASPALVLFVCLAVCGIDLASTAGAGAGGRLRELEISIAAGRAGPETPCTGACATS